MTRSTLSAPSPRCCFFSSTSRLVTAALFIILAAHACSAAYYGKLIGKLSQFHHGVSGEVYAVDGRTLHIKDFTYDGEGPAAYFYVGSSKSPNANGLRVRDERGASDVLKKYRKKDITLTLPEGKTLNNIKWFSVYCDEFAVNFGDVRIPRGFDYPRPQKLSSLDGVHGVSSEPIVVVDAQTFLIPGFSYDGAAPDAKFWVGSGPKPSSQGIRVPDENGKLSPLRIYQRKTIVLTLPSDLTVHQLGHFGVWCEAFAVDFGHVQIPSNLNVPPSLKMLGVSPQSKLNCEVLEDSLAFEVRWAVAGDSIVVQLVGKLEEGQYMSFGLSPNPERSVMVGGDPVVAWVDKQTLQGYAIDYFLESKSQCSGGRGSCPDTRIQENTNSVRLLNAAMVNGYSIVTYQRPLKASDELDLQITTNGSQAVIWAVGPLNERNEVSFHSHYLKTDKFIEFARPPAWNCPMPDGDLPHHADNNEKESKQELVATTRRPQRPPATPAPAATRDAWVIPPIQCNEPEDGVLYAQMGPTGGNHGYPAITGHVGWGISWYINGLLIPEIYVVRGKKYHFVTEGGENPEIPARYHPFYITDDPVGGYQHKTPEEKAKVKIFAGARRQRGQMVPTGVGRLCNWNPDPAIDPNEFGSFGAYQRHLTLTCDSGEPGWLEWTPDANTPDTVYYQCFTHRYLGWKIHVVDSCDLPETAASETHEVYASPPQIQQNSNSDLDEQSSIRVSSKVTQPAPEFYDNRHNNHHHHHHHNPHQNHRNPHQDRTSNYQLHQHLDHNDPHYNPSSNNNIINNNNNNNNVIKTNDSPMNLITTKIVQANNKINTQLTSTRMNNQNNIFNPSNNENRETYENSMNSQSYDDRYKPPPLRSPLYQSLKPIIISPNNNQNINHNHHTVNHLSSYHPSIRSPPIHAEAFTLVRSRLRSPFFNHPPTMNFYREIEIERPEVQTNVWPSRKIVPVSTVNDDSVNVVGNQQTSPDNDQEIQQTMTMPVGAIVGSNQPSNLVPDHRPHMNNYGQTKYPGVLTHPITGHYVYSRPMNNPTNSQKTGQLMIIRRPVGQMGQQPPQHSIVQRRPIFGSTIIAPGHDLASPSRPIFMERKKTTYHGQNHILPMGGKNDNVKQNKFTKMSNNERVKIEPKISSEHIESGNVDEKSIVGSNSAIEPARNTGFDPDSIVIESGFKPIIRNIERDTNSGRTENFNGRNFIEGYRTTVGDVDDEKIVGDENFEPMFVGPLYDREARKKEITNNVQRERNDDSRTRTRLDVVDDMEMAADRLESYYLPPSGSKNSGRLIGDRIGTAATLIAFDGKPVDDSNLSRSLPRVEEKRSRSRLTSDALTRTPQFGKFRGELPPPVPGDVRNENFPQLEIRNGGNSMNSETSQSARRTTKLSPLERTKRSPENSELRDEFGRARRINSTDGGQRNYDRSTDRDGSASSVEYDRVGGNRTVPDHSGLEKSTISSTGQMVINEIPYVILTIVLYFAM